MNLFFKTVLVTLIILLSQNAWAENSSPHKQLSKSNVKQIKIISSDVDQISMFLTDHNARTYHITALNEAQAESILTHFKGDNTPLMIESTPGTRKEFYEVNSWY